MWWARLFEWCWAPKKMAENQNDASREWLKALGAAPSHAAYFQLLSEGPNHVARLLALAEQVLKQNEALRALSQPSMLQAARREPNRETKVESRKRQEIRDRVLRAFDEILDDAFETVDTADVVTDEDKAR